MSPETGHEFGHTFYSALNGKVQLPRDINPIPVEVTSALAMSMSAGKGILRTAFFGGRVYQSQTNHTNGITEYTGIDPWRDEAKQCAKKANVTYLDGVNFKLHEKNPVGGAGMALLNLCLARTVIINGIGRIGSATHQEAMEAIQMGSNVALIVPEDEFEHVHDFLSDNTDIFPHCLPAYWASYDLQPADIIPGFSGLGSWLDNQSPDPNPAIFKGRSITQSTLLRILYYGHTSASEDPAELSLLTSILNQYS